MDGVAARDGMSGSGRAKVRNRMAVFFPALDLFLYNFKVFLNVHQVPPKPRVNHDVLLGAYEQDMWLKTNSFV